MTYELSTCILKMILLYIVILSSVTIPTVKSQGDAVCDCQEVGILKVLVQKVLFEQQMESARVSRLEARIKTYETTGPIPNDRLAMLEKNVNDINMKFNKTITETKEKQIGLQKVLISEKKERNKLVSSMNKIVNEYKDTIETFKEAMNNTIDKRFQDITAEQVKYKDTIETFKVAINKTIHKRFQDITAEQVKYKDTIETFKVAINKTIDKRFQDITAEQVEYKDTIETFKVAIDKTIDNRFQDITAEQVKYKDTIETFKVAINKTIHKRFQDITTEQLVYKDTVETFKVAINNTIDERFEDITAMQIKYWEEISLDLITLNETRYMVDTLGKIVEGGQVRLVNGSNQYEGRLEVWRDWSWRTVCDDGFDTLSASVVCRMLNFQHTNPVVFKSSYFGAGAFPLHLDKVKCSETDTRISQCMHSGWGKHNCSHDSGVGISCTPVRLVNGSNQYEGRLEVWHNGAWGTVCDDAFSEKSATVVCKMLNYPHSNPMVLRSAHFGPGASLVRLHGVYCNGTETSITQCPHREWGITDCDHHKDVGISCTPVRLVNGSHPYEGRLEVLHDGSWGTVCDDDFTAQSATVVCKMLNYPHTNPLVFMSAYFGAGKLPIHFDDVECSGTEISLLQCSHTSWGSNNCSHSEDVGISCTQVRLVNGFNQYEGRLEVWHEESWGTVCDDEFGTLSASVVCKMLEYQHTNPLVFGSAKFGAGILPMHLDDVKCTGTEISLSQCPHREWGSNNCGHGEDVGISCTPVRLVNGSSQYEGRLEVWHDGSWGTVCDNEFDTLSASVVCKMLNYPPNNALVVGSAHFGAGTLSIHLDDVKCTGNENTLSQCTHRGWGTHSCSHNDVVGISCPPDVRLVNGSNQFEGRLEVWHNKRWGTVCHDHFDERDATVVCRILNYPQTKPQAFRSAHFGAGSLPIHLDDVQCKGTETSLIQCLHRTWGEHNCVHGDDVGISCTPVRLVNGSNPSEGRLEVWHDGYWGTVCDDDFTTLSATVVCKMLNYLHTDPLVIMSAYFGAGKLPIHDVNCTGTEMSLPQCPPRSSGSNICSHREDVGISCTKVRLVNGSSQYEGRLEVWHDGSWGTVCDHEFTALSARVVCKMLNYEVSVPVVYGSAHFGAGTLLIHLDDVNCTGSELSIFDCPHSDWGSNNCGHGEDVGIYCAPVRLVDGLSQYEGRLEVWHENTWGTVCDDNFGTQSAKVVCKMLNYPYTSPVVHYEAHFGRGTGPIFLDEVQCIGSETSLFQCSHDGWRIHDCDHGEDVGISCK
ncbi:deleted in malignant brain tumors 1 protein-like isoform X3 [Ruditapes philippinarum]|uniref:deleted in malignant brain tumors 1 protein-like isoform X3 n=1 Tax=Ruditapes philippinarum TaxID=129788 RepID=UPI00295B4F3A|nr:deleted in malignant brain tumors 1 protein-like isoform X3 [Ruditapes philippinarum]